MESVVLASFVVLVALLTTLFLAARRDHPIWAFLLLMMVVSLLPWVAWFAVDSRTSCETVINSTSVYLNTTSYTYVQSCVVHDPGVEVSMYRAVNIVQYLSYVYFVAYIFYYFIGVKLGLKLWLDFRKMRVGVRKR